MVNEVSFSSQVTHLYHVWGFSQCGMSRAGHVHWQGDGLTVVVQAGGGASKPARGSREEAAAQPCLLMPRPPPTLEWTPAARWTPIDLGHPLGAVGKNPSPPVGATSGLPDDSLVPEP